MQMLDSNSFSDEEEEAMGTLRETRAPFISDALKRMGFYNVVIEAFQPLRSFDEAVNRGNVVGPAATMRLVPSVQRDGYMNAPLRHTEVVEEADEGSIFVIKGDAKDGCVLGDLSVRTAERSGHNGIICNGTIRDLDEVIEDFDIPIYAPNGKDSSTLESYAHHMEVVDKDCYLSVGGARVRPNDIIVADGDGALVVPREELVEVAENAREVKRLEKNMVDKIKSGTRWAEIYEGEHSTKYVPEEDE